MSRTIQLPGDVVLTPGAPLMPAVDPIESAGSLLLVDPTHPARPWVAGVPADGQTRPYLFWQNAANVLGAGTESALSAPVAVGSGLSGTAGKVERTGKGDCTESSPNRPRRPQRFCPC